MKHKIVPCIFVIILAVFFYLVMIAPEDKQASIQENRPLATMPELSFQHVFFGKFTSEYETYLNDNVGFRSFFVKTGTMVEEKGGIQTKDDGRVIDLPGGSRLVLVDGKIMEVFKENAEAAKQYTNVLNTYSQKFSKKCDLYAMLVPTQIEFDQTLYREMADSEEKTIDEIYAALQGFKTVDVYEKLESHIDEYIYFRTDHHWTQRGAYYGYQSIMEAKGLDAVPLENMKKTTFSGFLGYLFNQANVEAYKQYADEIECFEGEKNHIVNVTAKDESGAPVKYQARIYTYPAPDTAPTYGIFMGGDHSYAEVETDIKNGETALVIKDSYANTVIPFLTNHYQRIIILDPRSFDGTVEALVETENIDDIIFINYALTTSMPAFISYMSDIIE